MKSAIGIIPARYESRRFPGKPLALIQGRPMLQWVYERACRAATLDRVVIATDDQRIVQTAQDFGAEAQLTSPTHRSGTERVAEVASGMEYPIVVNIQGDEPLLHYELVDKLVEALQDDSLPMATAARKTYDLDLLADNNIVKVVINLQGEALYFSRSPIPFDVVDYFFHHIGIYGFQKDYLLRFGQMPCSRLEEIEKLEQLRALENGARIKVIETDLSSLSVDIPQDILKVEQALQENKND